MTDHRVVVEDESKSYVETLLEASEQSLKLAYQCDPDTFAKNAAEQLVAFGVVFTAMLREYVGNDAAREAIMAHVAERAATVHPGKPDGWRGIKEFASVQVPRGTSVEEIRKQYVEGKPG